MNAFADHDVFFHIRVLIGVVLGLSLTRILSGAARWVQHPGQKKLYATHVLWLVTTLISAIHFWWWEFALIHVAPWRFPLFVFILFYAFLFYLLASLLLPETMEEYDGYEDYFISRRRWFFGLFALTFAVDLVDTLTKGPGRLAELGPEYVVKLIVMPLLCGLAAWTANRRFQLAFALAYLVYLLAWILRAYPELV